MPKVKTADGMGRVCGHRCGGRVNRAAHRAGTAWPAGGDDNAAYDALNRIKMDMEGGTLSASGNNGSLLDTSSVSFGTSFSTDVSGNVNSGTTGFSFDSANQITGTGQAYDDNGNMTSYNGNTFVYDAWNRIVRVAGYGSMSPGGLAQNYQYDALSRRVYETNYSEDVYFDAGIGMGGNAIEEHFFAGGENQYVWGLMYQNDLVLRDDNTTSGNLGITGSGLGRRVYVEQDADWDVTSLFDTSGNAVRRMYYDAYGNSYVYTGDYSTGISGPDGTYSFLYSYQGGRRDWVTGLVHFGGRDYNPATFKWMEAEPFYGAYVDGANLYQAMGDNPVSYVDPSGLRRANEQYDPFGEMGLQREMDGYIVGGHGQTQNRDGVRNWNNNMNYYGGLLTQAAEHQAQNVKDLGWQMLRDLIEGLFLYEPLDFSGPGGAPCDSKDALEQLLEMIPQPKNPYAKYAAPVLLMAMTGGLGEGEGLAAEGEALADGAAAEGADAAAAANRPPNLTPEGAGRTGALRQALRDNGVPTSQQPSRVLANVDRRGNIQPGKVYEYDVPAPGGGTRTVRIRDDAGGHNYGPGDIQNRGPHFNDGNNGHYDY